MSQVLITTTKLDDLADAIGAKTGESTPMTIDDMTDAVDGITERDSTDLSASGATVTVPSGLYKTQATKSVASGTAGTPALTVSAVENHSKTIRSSVINQTGWITGGTVSGASTTVKASDLVSGSQNITSNANNIDVTNLASVNVQVPTGTPSLQTKSKSYTPTTSQQTESVTADNGYDGLDTVSITVNAMPSGSVTAPSSITGSSATVSTGTNTLTLSKTVSVTPNVTTAGYVSSGTAGNSTVSLSASVQTKGASTYRASTSQQTIASGTYLTGALTIAPVSQTNLTAENIKSGTTISISDGANNIWSVTGTYSGGGGSSNWTLLGSKDCGTISTSSTTAATINKDFTVSGVGDYDLLVVETSVNTKTNNRHAATARLIWLTAGTTIGTKNGATLATAVWNVKLSSNGTATSRSSTTARGVYPYSCTLSTTNGVTSAAFVMYSCYNSTQTGTINGTYTARVYGVKLYDLIGG